MPHLSTQDGLFDRIPPAALELPLFSLFSRLPVLFQLLEEEEVEVEEVNTSGKEIPRED